MRARALVQPWEAGDAYHRGRYLRSQTQARPARENPAHNGSKRREARSYNFVLSGPVRRNYVSPAGRLDPQVLAGECTLTGEDIDHSSTPYRFPPTVVDVGPGPAQTW